MDVGFEDEGNLHEGFTLGLDVGLDDGGVVGAVVGFKDVGFPEEGFDVGAVEGMDVLGVDVGDEESFDIVG